MKHKNPTKVFALWTDWNRPGAAGLYGGIGWYRIINPLQKLQNTTIKGKFTFGSADRVKIAQEIKSKGDVMVIKYVDSFHAANHILTIRDIMGIKLLVDVDDHVFKVHPHNYAYKDTHPGTQAYKVFRYLFREADGLICSTQPLADEMKEYNPNVWVIPNSIDPKIWKVPIKKNRSKKIKIGWVYGPTHEQDVPVIVPAIKEILAKYPNVEFNHIGWKSEDFDYFSPKQQKMVFGTSGYKDFPKFLASLGMDILIAPLLGDDFNRCKSNIKWMEGAMCEIPMVCSNVYPYQDIQHGVTGYLAKSTSEWIKYLSLLIENKDKRREIGKNAKEYVLKSSTVDKVLPKYTEIFDKITDIKVTVVVTRRKGESDKTTLDSLDKQTYQNFLVVRQEDTDRKGQNWAKNRGYERVTTEYVLFSDNDIRWRRDAIWRLVRALEENPKASYAYGAYEWFMNGKKAGVACNENWSPQRLRDYRKGNMVSTMSLVRTKDYPMADESIKRLTDWDLWLTMLDQGKYGVFTGTTIFETDVKKGMSFGNKETSYEEALKTLIKKHKL